MRKILVVDENPDVKALVGQALQSKRVEVLSAESGAQAVERLERERPDLVVCDVYMPDMDGYRICDFVRAHPVLRATPVLLMSDIVDRSVLARAARAGSDDVVRKPWAADELLSRIEGLLPGPDHEPAAASRGTAGELDGVTDPRAALRALTGITGVTFAALVDREGFLIDWAGDAPLDPDMVAALASSLAESSDGIGRELGQGTLQTMIFEYDERLVIVSGVDSASRFAVVLRDFSALDAVRRALRQVALAPLGTS
jgi:CheY-like chemotaxis protein